jgi:hypothetical protein
MRRVVFAVTVLVALSASAQEAPTAETALAPLQSREVIERLKSMRAQLLLEQEYNRLLEARVKRLELEEKLGIEASKGTSKKDLPKPPPRIASAPPSSVGNGVKELIVKSVTVQPFKEAFVIYKGRVYTVRPGDAMGDLTIKDITENGVVTNRSTVNME